MQNNTLKFRVWDKLGEYYITPESLNQQHYIITLNGKFVNLQNGVGGKECVIERFTGLLDKNGKEIYEGDYLKDEGDIDPVYFKDGCFWVDDLWLYDYADSNEIVGNIHQNPELSR